MRFDGKVALITGGGTGIGKATAVAFAKEGAKVVICGRREEPLKETVTEIAKNGGKATYFICDVAKSELDDKLTQDTVNKHGKIDILFNNAGVDSSKPIEETTDKDANNVIDIDVKGAFWMLRAVIRQMRKQGSGGAIINMSSISGMVGHTDRAIYCAAKGAIINMTRAIAIEVAKDNIRVNSVCPGPIETPMVAEVMRVAPANMQSYIDLTAMKRMASADEVATVVLFLASDDASYITGVNLAVDGGFTAGK